MDFGFTLKPEHGVERTISLTRQAEEGGFGYGWLFDSHILWADPYPILTLMALNTTTMRLGTCVTNPATREPTVTASALAALDEISNGRMDLGIGRGDSARRVMGKPPTTLARLEESTNLIRDLVEGRKVDQDGTTVRLPWTRGDRLPVWIAGYGPKALELIARVADGVILQLADVDLIRWFVGQLREDARKAGRDPNTLKVMAAAPAHVGDMADCRDRVRWFPALVSNHVVDLVNRYQPEELPPALTGYVRDRTGYDYQHHAEVGSDNGAFVEDEVVDRFCVIGSVDDHVAKLRELAAAGVNQFNIYLMNGDEEKTLEIYAREIIPRMAALSS
jgi:probable F420-dependent oxidoreductase